MRRERVGALLRADDRNGFYLGGFGGVQPSAGPTRPPFLVVPAPGDPGWLGDESRAAALRGMRWGSGVRTHAEIDRAPAEPLRRPPRAPGGRAPGGRAP